MNGSQMDDNKAILRLLRHGPFSKGYPFEKTVKARLDLGRERYGHGIRVNDDTTQWGTKTDSWLEMGLEEIDDLAIYIAAQFARYIDRWENGFYSNVPATEYDEIMNTLTKLRTLIVDLMKNHG